ncbi:hypothetical protein ULMA_07880 [Patiriisocius marinus]|uniref:Uncharacterized protein n=1 Tax=Patiriisocius marinus TaxID=1397112 RepID=A0A5J4IXY1_9FLAO|nr:hypothetical protein ULMA_07880 [Patiriisocius marinus]
MELIIDNTNNNEAVLLNFIQDLITAGNQSGTIVFNESVVISSNTDDFLFPSFVTLRFINGNKLLIGNRVIRIFGQIERK